MTADHICRPHHRFGRLGRFKRQTLMESIDTWKVGFGGSLFHGGPDFGLTGGCASAIGNVGNAHRFQTKVKPRPTMPCIISCFLASFVCHRASFSVTQRAQRVWEQLGQAAVLILIGVCAQRHWSSEVSVWRASIPGETCARPNEDCDLLLWFRWWMCPLTVELPATQNLNKGETRYWKLGSNSPF
jgi:hypothetical protein